MALWPDSDGKLVYGAANRLDPALSAMFNSFYCCCVRRARVKWTDDWNQRISASMGTFGGCAAGRYGSLPRLWGDRLAGSVRRVVVWLALFHVVKRIDGCGGLFARADHSVCESVVDLARAQVGARMPGESPSAWDRPRPAGNCTGNAFCRAPYANPASFGAGVYLGVVGIGLDIFRT